MDRYMVSDSPNGPWLEFAVTNMPHHALQTARGKMDWPVVWVAKMRPITGSDLLPPAEVIQGDIMEKLATTQGTQVVTQLEDEINLSQLYDDLCNAATGHLLDIETDIMVPDIKKPYGSDQNVRHADFLPPKPRLEDLL